MRVNITLNVEIICRLVIFCQKSYSEGSKYLSYQYIFKWSDYYYDRQTNQDSILNIPKFQIVLKRKEYVLQMSLQNVLPWSKCPHHARTVLVTTAWWFLARTSMVSETDPREWKRFFEFCDQWPGHQYHKIKKSLIRRYGRKNLRRKQQVLTESWTEDELQIQKSYTRWTSVIVTLRFLATAVTLKCYIRIENATILGISSQPLVVVHCISFQKEKEKFNTKRFLTFISTFV